jgi:hypothetical protein
VTQNPGAIDPQAEAQAEHTRSTLIATRMRNNATSQIPSREARLPSFAIEHAVSGDLGHLHAAHDLRSVHITSGRGLMGPLIVRFKSLLHRALHPLPESQSAWNGANVRVMSFQLRQLAAQARAIESLEQQMAELRDELHRLRVPDA